MFLYDFTHLIKDKNTYPILTSLLNIDDADLILKLDGLSSVTYKELYTIAKHLKMSPELLKDIVYNHRVPSDKKEIILIIGKSASGKDYLVDDYCKMTGLTKVLSRTTRIPRHSNDKSHIFVSSDDAKRELINAIAPTCINGGDWYYSTEEDLSNSDFYLIDPKGLEFFKRNGYDKKFNFISIYIHCNTWTRFKRIIKRDGVFKGLKRLIDDLKTFKSVSTDFVLDNSKDEDQYLTFLDLCAISEIFFSKRIEYKEKYKGVKISS